MDISEQKQKIRQALADLRNSGMDGLGTLLNFDLIDCDPEQGDFLFRCITQKWMSNPSGLLHGGISATVADHAMGLAANCVMPGEGFAVTIDMNISYHRPLRPEAAILTKVHVLSVTSTLIRLRCEECSEDKPEKVCVSATSSYFIKRVS